MTEREAERRLLALELFGMRFGLDRMHRLMTVLGMPQRRFAQVHVVGSNGKSSTVRFTAALLARHGLRAGSYTSPHLVSFRERIEVGGEPISGRRFGAAVARALGAAELVDRTAPPDDRVTQFEALTAAAYDELAARGVDAAVIEAGLGGRYDATNVIPSRVQVLTSVGLEHTRWLGPTIRDIAEEKLAVVRDHGTLVVAADLHPDALRVAERVARERHGALVRAPARAPVAGLALRGGFQRRNFALACAAAEAFLGHPLDAEEVRAAARLTPTPGRLEVVGDRPLVVHDGAHNPAGATALAGALGELVAGRSPVVGVISVLEDKDAARMLEALAAVFDRMVFTRCANPRALSPATLESLAAKLGAAATETVAAPQAALGRARALAGPDGAVVATGSIYLIADLVRGGASERASTM